MSETQQKNSENQALSESKPENSEIKKSKSMNGNSIEANKIISILESKNTLGLEKMLFLFENEDLNDETIFENQNNLQINEECKLNFDATEDINEKKLHDYLNCDLIKALDNSPAIPNISEISKVGTMCSDLQNFSLNSSNSQKYNQEEDSFNFFNNEQKTNLEHDTISFCSKKNMSDSENSKIEEEEKKPEIKKEEKTIKDYLGNINPLDVPVFIPKKFKNKKKEEENKSKRNKELSNILKNKYDDDVDSVVIISNVMGEEKTKLPLEIRDGDWICLYCNNLNFSFRIKCNRCGLLRKSSSKMMDNIIANENMGYNDNYYQNEYCY